MIQRCFALPYYVYCLRLRCLVSFLFYSTIKSSLINSCHELCKGLGLNECCAAENLPKIHKKAVCKNGYAFCRRPFVLPFIF
ncbi:Uncharacterised protein [Neisseria animalis]|nr:Uncharacterised protein [Neisseria animalis]